MFCENHGVTCFLFQVQHSSMVLDGQAAQQQLRSDALPDTTMTYWKSNTGTLVLATNAQAISPQPLEGCTPSNCIGRKELSYVYIKPDAMTRAITFGKGLSESEVVY